MTVLCISKMETFTDDLGRYVTTLTQEIMSKINEHEEQILVGTVQELHKQDGVMEYCNSNFTEFDVLGIAVNKAIENINNVAGVTYLAPTTEIKDDEIYRVEIEY